MRLQNKVCITGGNNGIGLATTTSSDLVSATASQATLAFEAPPDTKRPS
jgi:hypothetical protein